MSLPCAGLTKPGAGTTHPAVPKPQEQVCVRGVSVHNSHSGDASYPDSYVLRYQGEGRNRKPSDRSSGDCAKGKVGGTGGFLLWLPCCAVFWWCYT